MTALLSHAAHDDQPNLTPFPLPRKDFKWGPRSHQAAVLLAEDVHTSNEISAKIGINRQTLLNWLAHPQFAQRVAEMQSVMCQAIVARGAANKVRRLEKLLDQLKRIDRIIAERAAWLEANQPDVPGGGSGLLSREFKRVGHEVRETYRFDAALSKERREVLKQIAIEKGEWTEKHDMTSGGRAFKTYLMSVDEV
jgi:hypothetical protein